MEVAKRLTRAVEYLKFVGVVKAQKDISIAMGATQPNISKAMKGDIKFATDSFMTRFCKAYPIISLQWLLTGEGNMLTEAAASVAEKSSATAIVAETAYSVPLIPIAAQGGKLSEFAEAARRADCEMVISPIKEAELAITVYGDSMAPEYPNGSQLLIRRINEAAFIEWGKTYVLDTCNGAVVKTLVPSEREDFVRCLSINPNPIYAPFDVPWSEVSGVYRVLLCMSCK